MQPIAVLSLVIAVGVAGASCASSRRSARVLAWWNLTSCIACNVLQLNLPAVAGLDPLSFLDAFALAVVLILATGDPPLRWLAILALTFGVQLVDHVAYAFHLVSTLNYRRILNVFFFLQEATILFSIVDSCRKWRPVRDVDSQSAAGACSRSSRRTPAKIRR